jgi:hypothetical protein
MPEIKFSVSDVELSELNAAAAAAGTSRAAFIRERALARMTTVDYHSLVAGAVRQMHGDIPRSKIEHLVAYVINQTATSDRKAPCSIDRSACSRGCNP